MKSKYSFEIPCCDSCNSEGVPLKQYDSSWVDGGKMNLCNLCANTQAGNAYQYPDQHKHDGDILKTICFVGNEILKKCSQNGIT